MAVVVFPLVLQGSNNWQEKEKSIRSHEERIFHYLDRSDLRRIVSWLSLYHGHQEQISQGKLRCLVRLYLRRANF